MAKSPFLDKKALSRELKSNHRSIPKINALNEREFLVVKFQLILNLVQAWENLYALWFLSQGTGDEILTLCEGDNS